MAIVALLLVLAILVWVASLLTWWGAAIVGAALGVAVGWWVSTSPGPEHAPPRPRWETVLSGSVILAIVMAGTAGVAQAIRDRPSGTSAGGGALAAPSPAPSTTSDLRIEITVQGSYITQDPTPGDRCAPTSGFDDLQAGQQFVLATDTGQTVAVADADIGAIAPPPPGGYRSQITRLVPCVVSATFRSVEPVDGAFYRLVIGIRPPHTLTADDVRSGLGRLTIA